MMPVLLPVTIAIKGGIKQNQAALLVWNVYVGNTNRNSNKKNVLIVVLGDILLRMHWKQSVQSVKKVNIKKNTAQHYVWLASQEDTKQKKNKQSVSIAMLEDILTHLEQKVIVQSAKEANTSQIQVLLLVWIVFPENIKNKKNKLIVSIAVLEDILKYPEQKVIV